jgi:hypothetical protein
MAKNGEMLMKMQKQMQSSSYRWYLHMLTVEKTVNTYQQHETFRNITVFVSATQYSSSPFYPSRKNVFKPLLLWSVIGCCDPQHWPPAS